MARRVIHDAKKRLGRLSICRMDFVAVARNQCKGPKHIRPIGDLCSRKFFFKLIIGDGIAAISDDRMPGATRRHVPTFWISAEISSSRHAVTLDDNLYPRG